MTALVAVDACESLMQIDAGQETLEDLGLDRPVDQPGVVELNCVVPNALMLPPSRLVPRSTKCLYYPSHRWAERSSVGDDH